MVAGILVVAALVLVGVATADDVVSGWILGAIVYGPPAVGVAIVAAPGPPARKSFGAGLMLGWGAGFIVAAGLCVGGAITTPFYQVG